MDEIHELYQNHAYPPMSHPLSDPAVTAVSARMAGLASPHPRGARVLEIGCCSGHNLIPLAMRWPESRFTGIDLSERSISEARDRADAVGLPNIRFLAADLVYFAPEDGPYDYIIAHGFWSWVPDSVKAALLQFCREHLSENGIATVSFNVEAGWKPRLPVIMKTRAIQQAGSVDVMTALDVLKSVTDPSDPERVIIDDMMAKGPAILACDDFGPVNDPWPLDRFVRTAESSGLMWLGATEQPDSATGHLPAEVWEHVTEKMAALEKSPDMASMDEDVRFSVLLDEATKRTFRSEILCRADARLTLEVPEGCCLPPDNPLAVRAGPEPLPPELEKFQPAIAQQGPLCVTLDTLQATLPEEDPATVRSMVDAGVWHRALLPRIEALAFSQEPPEFPRLDRFRLLCAGLHIPLVDVWHKPCAFPDNHYQILAAMDGSRSIAELAEFSKSRCRELDFMPWLRHLAWRGMFS